MVAVTSAVTAVSSAVTSAASSVSEAVVNAVSAQFDLLSSQFTALYNSTNGAINAADSILVPTLQTVLSSTPAPTSVGSPTSIFSGSNSITPTISSVSASGGDPTTDQFRRDVYQHSCLDYVNFMTSPGCSPTREHAVACPFDGGLSMCGTVSSNPVEDLFNKLRAQFDNPEGDSTLGSATSANSRADESAVIAATKHGAERLGQRGISAEDYALAKSGEVFRQANGATAYLKQVANGRYNLVVEGQRGVITAMKNLRTGKVAQQARRYGWDWIP